MAMSNCVDYGQTAEDHQSLLVLVRHTGSALSSQMFNCAFEKVSRINSIHVEGQKRNIVISYRKIYSPEFNSWGDFQAHRKVLGLISVGKCSDQEEFEELFTSYKKIKGEYSSSIINSRFIVFGLNTDGTPISTDRADNNNDSESGRDCGRVEGESVNDSSVCDTNIKQDSKSPNAINNNSTSSSIKNSDNGTLAPLAEQEEDSEMDQPDQLKPPVTINDGKSKSSPRSIVKRQHSNSLTKESSGAEIVFYPNLDKAVDIEERIKEFVTSLFYVLEGKRLDRSFERNDKLSLLCAPFERKDYVGVDTDTKSFRKKCMGRLRKHLGDLCLQASMPGEAILHYNTALDLLKSVNDFLWMAGCLEGLCCTSIILAVPKESRTGLRRNLSFQSKGSAMTAETKSRSGSSSYANGLDSLADVTSHQSLNQDDVIDKFKEAITFYSKFKNAAVIEMETSLKACRFLILHRRYLQASDFLQNVVYINLPSKEEDKIQRYNTLSSLYHQIGFRRKAAFFKRISGMHCTATELSANWSQCYDLLLQCLDGYGLSVNPRNMENAHPKGWPVLQYKVLQELVFSARKSNNPEVAVRHKALLVHRMLPFLSVADQREVLMGLSNLTSKCPDTAKPLALDTGLILPPVVLLSLPTVRSFKLLPPSRHLQPHKLQGSSSSGGDGNSDVFIYTPLSLSSSKVDDSRPDFKWVCDDVCEATLQVSNPLVDPLNISKMVLTTSDLETEIFPDSSVIPSSSKSSTVKLKVKPKEAGSLKVQGYSTVVFGVKSNCRLRDLTSLKPSPLSEISIQVVPRLPHLALTCSLPKLSSFTTLGEGRGGGAYVVATGSAVLFAGQSVECVVTLQNVSEVPLESVRVWLETKGDLKGALQRMIQWSEENIESQLPLQPSHTLCFSLCINGDSDFLSPDTSVARNPAPSSRSPHSESKAWKNLEVALCLEYSGGDGMKAGYCRKCSLGLAIDVLPSVCISKWDVQTTDSLSHCRLCLDMVNLSGHSMTLQYDRDHSISLDPQQTKRIGMEIVRLDPSHIDLSGVGSQNTENRRIPSAYTATRCAVPDSYSQCLASGLDIRWTMTSTAASGKVHVDYITWTPEQLSLLLLSDMRWDVRLNGHPFSNSYKPRFDIGQVLELAIEVETSEDSWPSDASLRIQVHQTKSQGDTLLEADTYAVIGSPVCHVEKERQRQQLPTVTHTCSFYFFCTGWYYFNIFFSPQQASLSPSSSSSTPLSSTSLLLSSSSSVPTPSSLSTKHTCAHNGSLQVRTQQPPSSLTSTVTSPQTNPSNNSTPASSTSSNSIVGVNEAPTTATSQTSTPSCNLSNSSSGNSYCSSGSMNDTTTTTNNQLNEHNFNINNKPASGQCKTRLVNPGWCFGSPVRFEIS